MKLLLTGKSSFGMELLLTVKSPFGIEVKLTGRSSFGMELHTINRKIYFWDRAIFDRKIYFWDEAYIYRKIYFGDIDTGIDFRDGANVDRKSTFGMELLLTGKSTFGPGLSCCLPENYFWTRLKLLLAWRFTFGL